MSKPLQSAFSLLAPSMEAVKQNVLPFLVLLVIPTLIISFDRSETLEEFMKAAAPLVIGSFLSLLFYPPLVYTELHAAKGETVDLKQAFVSSYKKFWSIIGLTILVGLIVIGGLILFIVPGIIFLRRYMLSPYYMLDKNLGILESMRISAAESKQFSGPIYGVIGVIILIGLLGIFGLAGTIASAILSVLYAVAPAIRYQEIKQALKHN
jgi:uncharacterized membrane protein